VTVNVPAKRWELRPVERASVQLRGQRALTLIDADPIDERLKPGLRFQAEQAVRAAAGAETSLPTLADALDTMRLVRDIYK
jgi:hypothetical protein